MIKTRSGENRQRNWRSEVADDKNKKRRAGRMVKGIRVLVRRRNENERIKVIERGR